MSTVVQTVRPPRRRWFWYVLLLIAVIALIAFLTGPKVGAVITGLTPPRLPAAIPVTAQVWRDDQNWTAAQADEFHHKSQGTHTLPIPLSWFLALEEPTASPFAFPFAERGRFADNKYLLRFGFIGSDVSKFNAYGLPIGFAISPYRTLDGISQKETALGLTCAACHTGQLIYAGKRYVIEGGPAATDLGQLTAALGAALGQTLFSAKVPGLGSRFERFAKAVLNTQYSDITRNLLAKDLESVVNVLVAQPAGVNVTEGFMRLDALNRIGNQVFALDTRRYDNYVNINAPVNYPHIWTASWFNWVQYDASIMQPMVRNAGEAMGVRAEVDFTAPPNEGRFTSSIPMDNLHWIEDQLAGDAQPLQAKAFKGLNAPSWPDSFPAIVPATAADGAKLYEKHCSGCHRPALTPEIAHGKAPDADFWKYFEPIKWKQDGTDRQTAEAFLKLNVIPQDHIGTDSAQRDVLAIRQVNTAGKDLARAGEYSPGLGINIDICGPGKSGLEANKRITDGSLLPFAEALGAVVQMGINEWFRDKNMSGADRTAMETDRPNCLQSGAGYKARPLNGVWATAPFLHNGSVPTLYDLLSPVNERPKAFLLGNPSFDPVRVGLVTKTVEPNGKDYDDQGYFILDTSKPGNQNTGHEFSNDKHRGVIGPALSPTERNALIEFLKTL